MSDRRPVAEIKVVGHRWSARSSEVREFLARNQVAYHWYQSEDAEGVRLIAGAAADERALPVVITTDGTVAIQPTDAELADLVGLTTSPVGEGTGLGLDIPWRIVVKQHHGDLSVVSEPGDTRFQVRFPLVAPVPEAESADIDPDTLDLGAIPK